MHDVYSALVRKRKAGHSAWPAFVFGKIGGMQSDDPAVTPCRTESANPLSFHELVEDIVHNRAVAIGVKQRVEHRQVHTAAGGFIPPQKAADKPHQATTATAL